MQFLIKNFRDSENQQYNNTSRYVLAIEDKCLIIKSDAIKRGVELYRKSLVGWHNIYFNNEKYTIESEVNIKADILSQQENGKYKLDHLVISFIPLQIYNLNKFFDYLSEINENSLNEEQLRISEQLAKEEEHLRIQKLEEERLKIKKSEAKSKDEIVRTIEAERLKSKQLVQFLIKNFKDSENLQYNNTSRYILGIDDKCLIIKSDTRKNPVELYRKSLEGWHNICFTNEKEIIDCDINITTDILTEQEDGKYKLEHLVISFIPLQTYNLDKFFNYLSELNKNNLNEEQLKISEQLLKEEECLRIQKMEEEERLRILRLEAKQKEEERLRIIEAERLKAKQLEKQNFINIVANIREDRSVEKIFINYFNKYVKQTFLYPQYYNSLANYLLKNNYMYENVKMFFQNLSSITIDYSINSEGYKLNQIDKMVEFIKKTYSCINEECAKLLTWIEVCDVAITYYSDCFYSLYGKIIDNIDNLNINDSIYKYIRSDILNDSQETRDMFIYYLMSTNKFDDMDFNKGYIFCRNIFKNIYEELKNENEYSDFISGLLVQEQSGKKVYAIDDIDLMTGSEFEIFVGELFKEMGYKTTVTKASGDQGIDVVAEKNGLRFGVQAKCYSNTVSNSAIQEVVAGISFYKCDKAIVITNNFFTNSAIQLAKANDVVLWNREMLKQKIEELFS